MFLRPMCFLLSAACCAAAAAGEVDPRRPAAIVAENVPLVPEAVFQRLQQYQSVRGATFSGWSPDGRGILIGTRFGNSTQVHRVHEPLGRREQITFFEEPVAGQFIPRADDGAVLLSLSRGGDENYQIFLLDRAAYRTTLLTDGRSRNSLGPISRDGSKMIVASNRRNGRDTDLYLADCRRPDSLEMLLETDGEFWTAQDWSHDGSKLLLRRYVSINESYAAVLDVASSQKTPLVLPGFETARGAIGNLAFTPDDTAIYFTSDADGEFQHLGRLDLASRKLLWLTKDLPWDVQSVVVEPHSGAVAFATNEDGASRLYLLAGEERRPLDVPLGVIGGLEFSPDGKQLGFTLAKANLPSDAYSLDLPDGRLTQWTKSETGGLDPGSFVSPTRISPASTRGRFRPGTSSLARPRRNRKCPC